MVGDVVWVLGGMVEMVGYIGTVGKGGYICKEWRIYRQGWEGRIYRQRKGGYIGKGRENI